MGNYSTGVRDSQENPNGSLQKREQTMWNKSFILISIINFFAVVNFHMIVTVFPFYVKFLGGTEMTIGFAVGAYAVCCFISRPFFGWLLDNRSRKTVFILGLAVTSLFFVGYIVIPIISAAVVVRIGQGMFWSAISSSTNTNVCDFLPERDFAKGMSFFSVTNTVGMSIAPSIGLWLMNSYGFNFVFLLMAALPLISLFFAKDIDYRSPVSPGEKKGLFHDLKIKNMFSIDAMPASVVQLFSTFPYTPICSFAALFAADQGCGSAGLFFAIMAIASSLVRLFSGSLMDKYGEKIGVYGGNTLYIIALLLLAWSPSAGIFYCSAALYGIGLGFGVPGLQTMAVRIAPLQGRGAAMSTYYCAYDIANCLSGVLAGALITWCGYQYMFASMVVWVIIGSIIYVAWAQKTPSAFQNYSHQVR